MMTTISILLLLIINGFFVAAEFALVKVPPIRIQTLAAEGVLLAKLTRMIKNNLEPYLAACQLGITMASLGLGWIGEPAVAALLEPVLLAAGLPVTQLHFISFMTGFILFSSLHIVIGEQVPKTYAIRTAEQVAMWTAPLLIAFYWMAFPVNWLLNKASSGILRSLGVKEVSHVEVLSGSEISGLIDISKDHGGMHVDQAQMLQNLFRFDERIVHGIMVPRSRVEYIDLNTSLDELLTKLKETNHSRLAVLDGGWSDLRGMIFVKDLLSAFIDHGVIAVEDHLRPAQLVPESQAIKVLFDQMRENREHLAFAVDEFGQIDGIVTMEDLLEEVVGEIDDESDFDEGLARIEKIDEGPWIATGYYAMHDVFSTTGFSPETPISSSTLSGFMMHRLQKVPSLNDTIEESGFVFEVVELNGAHVAKVKIAIATDEDKEAPDDDSTERPD